MDSKSIEGKIRRASKGQLLVLQVVANSINDVITTSEMFEPLYGIVDDSTGTASQSAGGVVSAITRMKDEKGKHLLLPFGKKRWKLNITVINKGGLRELVSELLDSW